MKVLVIGSKEWSNYSEVMRQLTLLLEDAKYSEDKSITFVHSGTQGAENMITEYVGKVEKFMRQKGYSVKEQLFKSNQSKKSINDFDMIQEGADLALIFSKDRCKRTTYCNKILEQFEIPTIVIND